LILDITIEALACFSWIKLALKIILLI